VEDFNRLADKDYIVTREAILEGTEHISLAIRDLIEAIKDLKMKENK
tara:strand:+ start:3134 stop:3274 length:141 start_codon:yes stop_codon:yes gene_type:complete